MWQRFAEASDADKMRPDHVANAKYLYFCGSVATYNFMIAAIRTMDPATINGATEAMRLNFDEYFSQSQHLQLPPTIQ